MKLQSPERLALLFVMLLSTTHGQDPPSTSLPENTNADPSLLSSSDLLRDDNNTLEKCNNQQNCNRHQMSTEAATDANDAEISTIASKKHSVTTLHYSAVLVPVILLVGLFGNTMTIIVMSSNHFKNTTMSRILIALSCSDTALILMSPFNKNWFQQIIPLDPRSLSNVSCKTFFWAWRVSKMTSSWLVVLISIERLIAVYLPLKAKVLNTKRNASIAIIMVYLMIGGFVGGWVVVADTVVNGVCIANYPTQPQHAEVSATLVAVGTSIYCFVPSAIITIFNCAIIWKLVQHFRTKETLSEDGAPTKTSNKPSKTSVMLIILCISFILLVMPVSLAHNIAKALNVDAFRSSNRAFAVFFEVAQTLEQINYSINFFLYVSSSGKFREQAKRILCGTKRDINADLERSSSRYTTNTA